MRMLDTKRKIFALLLCLFMVSVSFQALAVQDSLSLRAAMDPRIELLYIIDATANASSWHNCQLMNTVYNQQVIKHFSPFAEHEAVKYYKAYIEDKFDLSLLEKAFLCLAPSLPQAEISIPEEWPIELGVFVQKAQVFYQDSAFQAFMLRQASIVREIERTYQAMLNRQNWQVTYFTWFSASISQFYVVLSPLKRSFHQGYLISVSETSQHYTLVLGLTAISNGFLVFAPSRDLQQLVLQKASKDLILNDMKQYPHKLNSIEESMLTHEKTWKDLGFANSTDFVAHQMALCIYWKFLDELNQEDSSLRFLQEAEEEGYFLIKFNWALLHDFSHSSEFQSWKDYTSLWMDQLCSEISRLQAQKI
jgi:hypothetical protein